MNRHLKILTVCVLIVAAGLVIYLQVMNFSLVEHEDRVIYFLSLQALEKGTLPRILWHFPEPFSNWVPVTYLSYITDFLLWGDDAGRHHLNALFYHILNGLLLFGLLYKMTGKLWPGAFAAALLIVHPLNVEAVAYWAQRGTLVSTLFAILSLLAYVHYIKKSNPVRQLPVFIFFVLGLMARPSIVYLPVLMMILDYWPLNRFSAETAFDNSSMNRSNALWSSLNRPLVLRFFRLLKEKALLFLVAVSFFVGNAWYTKTHYVKNVYFKEHIFPNISPLLQELFSGAGPSALLLHQVPGATISYLGYIWKTIWPVTLSWYLPTPPFGLFAWWETTGAFVFLFFITLTVIRTRRRAPYLLTGWLWFLVAISPAVVNNTLLGNFITDHYAYFPIIGLFIMISWGGESLAAAYKPMKKVLPCLATALVIILVMMSWRQAAYWKNRFTLYEHALAIEPQSAFLHNNLGKALYENGDIDAAIDHLETAKWLAPGSITIYVNLAIMYYAKGEMAKAEACLLKAHALAPGDIDISKKLAAVYRASGKQGKAAEVYKRLLTIKPEGSAKIKEEMSVIERAREKEEAGIKSGE